MADLIETLVRGQTLRLLAENRAMTLCARMNYETEVLDFIDAMAPASVFYDLGACEGRFSLYAALKGHRVWAFEPEALNHAALLANLAVNPLQGGELHAEALALGAQAGMGVMKIGQPWAAGHHKVVAGVERADLTFATQAEQAIQLVSLDAFVAGAKPHPQYLKVDVDGSELPFMAGAQKVLANPILRAVMMELYEPDPGTASVLAQFAAWGFTVREHYVIESGLVNVWLSR